MIILRILLIVGAVFVSGCASAAPKIDIKSFTSPTARVALPSAGISDGRARFAAAFRHAGGCADPVSGIGEADCSRWLDLSNLLPSPELESSSEIHGRVTLVIIGGIFGECVAPWVSPFSFSEPELATAGIDRIIRPPVEGRSSVQRNALLIDAYLKQNISESESIIVVAYSKGLMDFLESFVRYQKSPWTRAVKSVVSIAGVVNGTPIANAYEELYSKLSKLPFSTCAPGDGGGVASLQYDASRGDRYAKALASAGVSSYSLSSVVTEDRISPFLAFFYKQLSRLDERNDGQVLLEDSILPGTELLAIVRGDHWAISLPFSESTDPRMRILAVNNSFPRTPLILATIKLVMSDLSKSGFIEEMSK